jgi:hypothetical protein
VLREVIQDISRFYDGKTVNFSATLVVAKAVV